MEFDVAPQSLLYASYETGYRSGGFSAAEGFETFQPEYLDAVTVGMKNRFFNNRVQLNIEGFYWKYKDQQVNHVGPDLSGNSANYTQDIGRSTIKGIEVESQFLVTPTTLLSANIAYLDAQNKSFTYQQPGPTPPLTGCVSSPSSANPAIFNVDCSDQPAFNSPKWTANLAAQQTVDVGDYRVVLGADTQYRSKRSIGFQYLPEQVQGSTWTSNAQITFGPQSDKWSISAYVRNIENDRNTAQTTVLPFSNILVKALTPPRTYGIRASAKF